MSGCNFPTLTREDVAALGEIEAVINRARVGTIAALDSSSLRPRRVTIDGLAIARGRR